MGNKQRSRRTAKKRFYINKQKHLIEVVKKKKRLMNTPEGNEASEIVFHELKNVSVAGTSDTDIIVPPENVPRREESLRTVGREDLSSNIDDYKKRQHYKICEEHFDRAFIIRTENSPKKFLKGDAFPTINLPLHEDGASLRRTAPIHKCISEGSQEESTESILKMEFEEQAEYDPIVNNVTGRIEEFSKIENACIDIFTSKQREPIEVEQNQKLKDTVPEWDKIKFEQEYEAPASSDSLAETLDENYDHFGKYVASLLRMLAPQKAIEMQPKIIDIIMSNIKDND